MPPKKLSCQVRGCRQRSRGIDLSTLMFHRFPLEVTEASQWAQFSGSELALDKFNRLGPIGVRKLWMCSLHFEPRYYKMVGSKANLRHGAIPTLSGPTDETEPDVDADVLSETGGATADESDDPGEGISTAVGAELAKNTPKRKRERLDDRFYDFLKNNDDSDSNAQRYRNKSHQPHPSFCVCGSCRADRAARAIEKGTSPHKAVQTADTGPQPDASPVPIGGSQDSCRLCFSTDQLEPLCSGMIVVRDEMLDKIYVCTGVLVIPRPKVSIFICTPCAQLINSFHAYRQQVCSNNQALLRAMTLKASKASTTSAPKIQKVSPLPQVRKPTPVTIRRKPPVGLIPVIDTIPSEERVQTLLKQYPKIAPKLPMMVEPEVTVLQPVKDELDDPLEGCGETSQKAAPTTATSLAPVVKSNVFITLQSKQAIAVMKKDPPKVPIETIEVDDDGEDLPDGERWNCWHCENAFPFQFECAKHLLQVHGENVGSIKKRLKLDELNANMLQMMSVNQKK